MLCPTRAIDQIKGISTPSLRSFVKVRRAPFLRIYDRRLPGLYRSIRAWQRVVDATVRYGIEQVMVLGREPDLKALPEWPEWKPKDAFEKQFTEQEISRLVESFAKARPAEYKRVDVVPWLADWRCLEHEGAVAIGPHQVRIYGEAFGRAAELAKLKTPWNLVNRRAVAWAAERSAKLVTAVTEETKAGIRAIIADGIERGRTIPQIGREMRAMPTFGLNVQQAKALAKYGGRLVEAEAEIAATIESSGSVAAAQDLLEGRYPKAWVQRVDDDEFDMEAMVGREADRKAKYRSEMIARTETGDSVSEGSLDGYEEAGVEKAEFEASADACKECLDLNGNVYTLEESHGIITVHPNCRCNWLPVIPKGGLE